MQFSEMLKPENVRIVQSIDTWQNAIRLACAPLEEGGYVEPCYATTSSLRPRRWVRTTC